MDTSLKRHQNDLERLKRELERIDANFIQAEFAHRVYAHLGLYHALDTIRGWENPQVLYQQRGG